MTTVISNLLAKNRASFHSLFPFNLDELNIHTLDLSVNNPELKKIDLIDTQSLNDYIQTKLLESKADICLGGYLENRLIYQKSEHFGVNENARSIHLGIDIWSKAGTSIFAPMNSKIHSFKNNNNFGDYGATIILSHELERYKFHTLYGHLSKQSLKNCEIGGEIKKGDNFAHLGAAHENGNWPPHLHFQIIIDMENNNGDYPGVCNKKELQKYKKNCPNPELILKL